jgi:hypothetical protein
MSSEAFASSAKSPSMKPTRRSVLSLIPAGLLAAWQGLGARSAARSSPPAPSPQLEVSRDNDSYTYIAGSVAADPLPPHSDAGLVTITVFDHEGRMVEHRTIVPNGSPGGC